MPVCKIDNININYEVHGSGFPIVLSHSYKESLQMWEPQIKLLSAKYKVIVYDIRGFGLSSAPAGENNYTLDILVEDLHQLLVHLDIKKAYIGGLSLGGAITVGYAIRHPDTVKALLIFDIHGGVKADNQVMDPEMAKRMEDERSIALERGMADLARHQIAAGTVFPPILKDEKLQQQHIEIAAKCPINGFIGIGRALPWEAEWQKDGVDKINVPTLIMVGSEDMIKPRVKVLHEHIKNSRYVEIKNSYHNTARWRPDAFNNAVIDFLETVENGNQVAGEMLLD